MPPYLDLKVYTIINNNIHEMMMIQTLQWSKNVIGGDDGMNQKTREFHGKYRGVVTDNRDPLMMGRVRAQVPDVLGQYQSGWAMPCVPYAGDGVGLFLIPPVNANVWIEFEHGDPNYPIWAGCFWSQGKVPATQARPEMKVLKTDAGTITLNDTPGVGGITIETTAGMKVILSLTGIEINTGRGGSIGLTGPKVTVNNGALEVI
jgi:uncharacterized protein involved in type VI secretion and phage assembly